MEAGAFRSSANSLDQTSANPLEVLYSHEIQICLLFRLCRILVSTTTTRAKIKVVHLCILKSQRLQEGTFLAQNKHFRCQKLTSLVKILLLVGGDGDVGGRVGDACEHEAV